MFEQNFIGMTAEPVVLADLLQARTALVQAIVGDMPEPHRRFLISFERGEPDWELALQGVNKLPAVQWRQQNLNTLSKPKRAALVAELERVLGH
jgi:hypothetical protein